MKNFIGLFVFMVCLMGTSIVTEAQSYPNQHDIWKDHPVMKQMQTDQLQKAIYVYQQNQNQNQVITQSNRIPIISQGSIISIVETTRNARTVDTGFIKKQHSTIQLNTSSGSLTLDKYSTTMDGFNKIKTITLN